MPETNKLSRSEQARINGAKSRGPTSIEGKAKSSMNAMKHGFAAAINVVLHIEDVEEFRSHVDGLLASYSPTDYQEKSLVSRLASISWRQSRLDGLETGLIDAQVCLQEDNVRAIYPKCGDDPYFQFLKGWQALAREPQPAERRSEDHPPSDPTLPPDRFDINSMEILLRYQLALNRQFHTTLSDLNLYRKNFSQAKKSIPLTGDPQINVIPISVPIPIPDPEPTPPPAPEPEPAPAPAEAQAPAEQNEPEKKPSKTPQPPPNRPAPVVIQPLMIVKPAANPSSPASNAR